MHTNFQNEIYRYSKERVFSIKLGIIGLVLIAGAVGLIYIAKTVVFAQQALDVMI
jgi:hypothetical protein